MVMMQLADCWVSRRFASSLVAADGALQMASETMPFFCVRS